jgi:hypothetical protein
LDLCHASLLAPPPEDEVAHPVKLYDLLERLESQASTFSQEEKLLLNQMSQSMELLPWNRKALQFALRLEDLAGEVESDSGHADLPPAFFSAVLGVLTPHPPSWSHTWAHEGNANGHDLQSEAFGANPPHQAHVKSQFLCGVHAAAEVRDGLEDVSAVLRMHDVEHTLVLDNLTAGAFIHSKFGEDQVPTRFVWGSSVHYAEGPSAAVNRPRLVPAARFQVAALQAESDAKVIVVPHFSWPKVGDRVLKARSLLDMAKQQTVSSQSCAFQ